MTKHQLLTPAFAITIAIASTLLAACSATPSHHAGAAAAATGSGRVKPYPLKTCLVTDTDLHSMGSPVSKVYGDQQIKFCCRPCIARYEENPGRYNAKL